VCQILRSSVQAASSYKSKRNSGDFLEPWYIKIRLQLCRVILNTQTHTDTTKESPLLFGNAKRL